MFFNQFFRILFFQENKTQLSFFDGNPLVFFAVPSDFNLCQNPFHRIR